MTSYVLVTLFGVLLMAAAAIVAVVYVVFLVIGTAFFGDTAMFYTIVGLFIAGYICFGARRFLMDRLSKQIYEKGEDVTARIRSSKYGGFAAVGGGERATWCELEVEIPLDDGSGQNLIACIDQLFDKDAAEQLIEGADVPIKFYRDMGLAMVALKGSYVRLSTGSFFPWLHKVEKAPV